MRFTGNAMIPELNARITELESAFKAMSEHLNRIGENLTQLRNQIGVETLPKVAAR